jgi:hypothetical protein
MHIECHAMLGWTIGNALGADRRQRNYCFVAAVLPDIDAAAFLLGPVIYSKYHHTFGHSIFLGIFVCALAAFHCRSMRALLLTALSFASHLVTDMYFTRMDVYIFWPASSAGFLIPGGVGLVAPINTALAYFSYIWLVILALITRRTPIDIVSPGLDRIVVSFFRRRTLTCSRCSRPCNQTCTRCEAPVCWKHGHIKRGFRVFCEGCAREEPKPDSS